MAVRAGRPINREKRLAGNDSRVRSFRSSIPKRDVEDCGRRSSIPGTQDVGGRIKDSPKRVIHWVPFAEAITRDLLPLAYFLAPEPDWPRRKSRRHSEFDARSDGQRSAGLRDRARR